MADSLATKRRSVLRKIYAFILPTNHLGLCKKEPSGKLAKRLILSGKIYILKEEYFSEEKAD